MTTPYCPKCGSVKVDREGKRGCCLETDCGHEGQWQGFKTHPGFAPPPGNKNWRDPIALLPGDYEDNN